MILTHYKFDQVFEDPETAERAFQNLASSSPDLALERLYWHPDQIGRLRGWAFLGIESPERKRARQVALEMSGVSASANAECERTSAKDALA